MRYFSINGLLFVPFYAPNLGKVGPNFGKVGRGAFGLSVSVWVGVLGWVFAGWGVCQWGGGVQRCGWLAGSVGHFFLTFNGE